MQPWSGLGLGLGRLGLLVWTHVGSWSPTHWFRCCSLFGSPHKDVPYSVCCVPWSGQALELFGDNPFKVALITNKVPEGALTTAYRCGPLIDLCMGPHVPGECVQASTCELERMVVQ